MNQGEVALSIQSGMTAVPPEQFSHFCREGHPTLARGRDLSHVTQDRIGCLSARMLASRIQDMQHNASAYACWEALFRLAEYR
jgi:hypothetical protein